MACPTIVFCNGNTVMVLFSNAACYVQLKPLDQPDVVLATFTFFDNGRASLDVILANRSPIDFFGKVTPLRWVSQDIDSYFWHCISLFIASLNSGSNANCYYIGNAREAVLVDAGLSCRETERRMNRLQLSMEKVKALFVSHEHADHISGVPGIAKKYKLPVYITDDTLRNCKMPLDSMQVHSFRHNKKIFMYIEFVRFF